MGLSQHIKLIGLAIVGWMLFVIIGWPSYFQDWKLTDLLYLSIAVYYGLGFAIYWLIEGFKGNKTIRSFWVAFYISVLVMILDYVYITVVRSEPFELENRFWVLAVFYIIPWIQALLLYPYVVYKNSKGFAWAISGVVFLILSVFLKIKWATFEGSFFDMMSDYPERKATMLGSALRYAIYGSTITASFLSFARYAGTTPILQFSKWKNKVR